MLDQQAFVVIYFFYGLSFFSMGLLVAFEGGRSYDERLRSALRPLAAFGLLHGTNEWIEMFELMNIGFGRTYPFMFSSGRLIILAFSFISLAAFGSFLISWNDRARQYILVIPVGLETLWVFGLLVMRSYFYGQTLWDVADTWTRYTLAIPSALLAVAGLIIQQREFRKAGLFSFGRDALWAAVAFIWYGPIGQLFSKSTPLPPSNILNGEAFLVITGFPIELLRAMSAGVASLFIIRFIRSFQIEIDHKISLLQEEKLKESREREALRGELFRRVVAAQESERQRIARDLHDETGQSLTAIGMGLRGLATTIRHGHADQAVSTLKQLESLNTAALTELQRLIADLRPSHLDDLGLPATIRWYAGMISERAGLNIKVDIKGNEKDFSASAKTAIFRVVQEALNNIIKHSNAKSVEIFLNFEPRDLRIRVRDDGRGFDVHARRNQTSGRPSLGLVGMQERASLFDGTFFIASVPGQGTLVEVTIPYLQQAEVENDEENTPATGG